MSKLIIIANRLPVTAEKKKNNEIVYHPSVGGLATGMSSLSKTYRCVWVGFSGLATDSVEEHDYQNSANTFIKDYGYYPVPLTGKDIELYYNGFSNQTLWPLFHYFQAFTVFNDETWRAYVDVNIKFYETLTGIYEPGDLIWIHDYHLMLLPGIIREHIPEATIGFFLHIPFPSYELFRLLPWRSEILTGLVGADLIGFHTYGYVRHILSSIQRILGIENSMGQLRIDNRSVKCDIFPLGIDYQRYSDYIKNKKITREIERFKKTLEGKKMILSMDRLDFTKGIDERLNAYSRFLKKYPEYHGKVHMVLVTVPSRTQVETYITLRRRINEQVGRINGKYNTLHWSPIQYLYRSLPFEMIMTLYHCADVCLVTPLRDGMNLIAKEYIASRVNGDGVLILSEMAGASEELGEAIRVNPNNREEVADAIATALTMDTREQRDKIMAMQSRLKRNDVVKWSASFIEKLSASKPAEEKSLQKTLGKNEIALITSDYQSGTKRLFLLDYDGTLVRFENRPEKAVPGKDILKILAYLANSDKNDVVIISGRTRDFLDRHFGNLRVILIAEHGGWIKSGDEWKSSIPLDPSWKNEVRPILEMYCDRTPGSFFEEKDYSMAWHYRLSDNELAVIRAMELKGNLLTMVANYNLGIIEGNKVLEIKSLEINKGKIASYLLSLNEYDFIIGIGDDTTDEDLFVAIPDKGYSIKVGNGSSKASYHVSGVDEVRRLLEKLVEL